MSEVIFDIDQELRLQELRLRRNLLRRQKAENIVNFYRNGDGIHRLSLEEFTSPDMGDNFEEDDDDSIDSPSSQVNQEGELVRGLGQNAIILEEIFQAEERFGREEELERVLLGETYDGELYLDEEVSGFRRPPNEVEGILQKLSRVEISRLEADDLMCSICQSEYGKDRGDKTEPASESDQKFPDDQAPESPVMLPCGHLLGDLCIYKWLEEPQPASCPLCRHML